MKIRSAESGHRFPLLSVLHSDHVAAVERHDAVDSLCRTWLRDGRLTVEEAQQLIDLLYGLRKTYQEHIEIEETKLFPFAAKILTRSDLDEIGIEMAHRRGLAPVG